MVDMGDDGNIANFFWIKHGKCCLRVTQVENLALVAQGEGGRGGFLVIMW